MLTSLGTALLDEFCWVNADGHDVREREVRFGGGGAYATIGARIWKTDVGLLVHRGPDFPAAVQAQLDSFGTIWHYWDTETPTPRALNTYGPPSPTRHFEYLAPPPPLTLSDLSSIPALSCPAFLHLCCPPAAVLALLPSLLALPSPPQLVYEPIPFSCVPASLPALRDILPHVRVFSPNHEEAASLLDFPPSTGVEELAASFRAEGALDVVIRAGERGAYVLPADAKGSKGPWVPPYHTSADGVKDTVGAGNSFLGGLMAGLAQGDNLVRAARRGAVSAGVVVESVGLPTLKVREEGEELWNGKTADARLAEMDRRETGP
ncbi:hypothetical protein JCM10450v2_003944 [Rhodotorula kratochvilovae]